MIIMFILFFLGGCASLAPFPQAARAGDTIALGLGPVENVRKPNTKIYFESDTDPGNLIDITSGFRTVFNLYADRTSLAYSPNYGYVNEGFKYIHHEPWETVIALDLPLGLPVGPGKITYQTTISQPYDLEPVTTGAYPDLNTITLPLEILPGTGTEGPSLFEYALSSGAKLPGDLNALTPQRQAAVIPPVEDTGGSWVSSYGAIEFSIILPMIDNEGGSVTEDSIRLVAQDVSNFTKSKAQMAWAYNGTVLKVMFLSSSGNLRYFEPRFSVIAETADFDGTPTIDSVKYYDVDGNEIFTGPAIGDYTVKVFGRYL